MSWLSCTVACAYAYVHARVDAEALQAERICCKNTLGTLVRASGLSHAFLCVCNDVSGEGMVSLPACLPPQECLPKKQMPNVAQRQ